MLPHRIPVKPSLIYYYLVIGAHLLTGVLISIVGFPALVVVGLIVLVVMHCLWFLSGWRQLQSVTALIIERGCLLIEQGMAREEVSVIQPVLLNTYVVLLRVKADKKILSLILLFDSVSKSDLRSLRVWLKARSIECVNRV